MNIFETNALAETLLDFIKEKTTAPIEGVEVLGITLLKLFNESAKGVTVETFAEDFKQSLIKVEHGKMPLKGTEQ